MNRRGFIKGLATLAAAPAAFLALFRTKPAKAPPPLHKLNPKKMCLEYHPGGLVILKGLPVKRINPAVLTELRRELEAIKLHAEFLLCHSTEEAHHVAGRTNWPNKLMSGLQWWQGKWREATPGHYKADGISLLAPKGECWIVATKREPDWSKVTHDFRRQRCDRDEVGRLAKDGQKGSDAILAEGEKVYKYLFGPGRVKWEGGKLK